MRFTRSHILQSLFAATPARRARRMPAAPPRGCGNSSDWCEGNLLATHEPTPSSYSTVVTPAGAAATAVDGFPTADLREFGPGACPTNRAICWCCFVLRIVGRYPSTNRKEVVARYTRNGCRQAISKKGRDVRAREFADSESDEFRRWQSFPAKFFFSE